MRAEADPGRPPSVAVVGAGISGLVAAHRLRTLLGPHATITVIEQRDRIGGVLRTVDLAGVPFDVGAEAFLARRPEVPALLAELGLAAEQVSPTGASASIRAAGRTVPLPGGTVLGVPTSASRLDGLLSPAGLRVVAAEPARPLRWETGADPGLGGLLRERFGDELADRLADPLLGGVYAGRVDALGLRATIPAVAAALDGGAASLTAAADVATGSGPPVGSAPQPVFGAVRGGYGVLLAALAGSAGARMRLGTTVRELRRRPGGWRLTLGPTTEPELLDVDAVLLAVPAPAAARLLTPEAPGAATAAGEIELASSVVVALAFRADAAALPRTSGVLVAAGEPLAVKGVTHSTTKWAHLGPDGLVRLRASLGRFGEAVSLRVDDAELVRRVRADLAVLTGVTAAPVAVHVQRWGGGLPQYAVGHLDRVRAIEDGVAPGLAVSGAALHGVGVPACIATARAAAQRLADRPRDAARSLTGWQHGGHGPPRLRRAQQHHPLHDVVGVPDRAGAPRRGPHRGRGPVVGVPRRARRQGCGGARCVRPRRGPRRRRLHDLVHADNIEALQAAYADLRRSTALGRASVPVWSQAALHRPAEFNKSHVPAFVAGEEPKKYVCVYPFVRSLEWYLLPDEERRQMLADHGKAARGYPDVRANTVPSFALGDYEWILAFEADELDRIVDLMRHLRATDARRHVREEVPFYTGPRVAPAELVAALP